MKELKRCKIVWLVCCVMVSLIFEGCGANITYQAKYNIYPQKSIKAYKHLAAHPDNPQIDDVDINQLLEGIGAQHGLSPLKYRDLESSPKNILSQTLVARCRETGRTDRGYGFSIEVTVILSDYLTQETIYTGVGEHMGMEVYDDYQGAIRAALSGLGQVADSDAQLENIKHIKTSTKNQVKEAKTDDFTQGLGVRWAVIIGVSNYHDSRIPSLRYGSSDAQAFYEWLVSSGGGGYAPSRIKLLLDHRATEQEIKEALFVWLKQALEEDLVIIYFAGHGSPESPDSPENLFLLPYDAKYDSIATSGFPMWDVETALKRFIKAKKVVVIADACHAGGIGQSFDVVRRSDRGIRVNPINARLRNLSKVGDGICVISASDDKQFSQESKRWGGGHGVFTYFLLKGLKGGADYTNDGKVTLGELLPYLSEQVRRATKNAQSPIVAGKFDPAMTIGR